MIGGGGRTGTFLEINANPDRRDLADDTRGGGGGRRRFWWTPTLTARTTLANIRYGVATARRAWLPPTRWATRAMGRAGRLRKSRSRP